MCLLTVSEPACVFIVLSSKRDLIILLNTCSFHLVYSIYMYICVCIYVCMYICLYIYICVFICVCVYIYIYKYMYVYICMCIYILLPFFGIFMFMPDIF